MARIAVPEIQELKGPKGWEWRGPQQELIERIANSDKPVVLLQAEPGIGKTSIAWGLSQIAKGNTSILMHTRQLQRQYLRDFNLKMIEGRRHYQCKVTHREANGAPCSFGVKCDHKGKKTFGVGWTSKPDCHYYLAKMEAEEAKATVHNYAYWLTETQSNVESAFTGIDWIVCDEAHDLQTVLMDFYKIRFDQTELHRLDFDRVPLSDDFDNLIKWQKATHTKAYLKHTETVRQLRSAGFPVPWRWSDGTSGTVRESTTFDAEASRLFGELRVYAAILDKLDKLNTGPLQTPEKFKDEWVIDRVSNRKQATFAPLYADAGMRHIRRSANKVLLMSAYLAPDLLIPMLKLDPNDCEVIEAPPMYDRGSSPFVFMPTTKMSFKTTQHEWKRVTKVIDEIIDTHAPKSGIIIVPSRRLRNTIAENSRHRGHIITYEGEANRGFDDLTKDRALDRLRYESKSGQAVLIGQSIATGIDLPYVIGFSIIVKLAFPPLQDPIIKARTQKDKHFQPYHILCQLVQAAGRSKRAEDHDCVTYILDAHFQRFYAQQRKSFPAWFSDYLVDGRKLMTKFVSDLKRKGVVL